MIETSNGYARRLLLGIRDFAQQHGGWSFQLSEGARGQNVSKWLLRFRVEGIIARIENRVIERAVRAAGVPVVNVSASGFGTDFPTVISDSEALARMGADHLFECGYKRFAFCGDARFAWSRSHETHFVQYVRSRGYQCYTLKQTCADRFTKRQTIEELAQWVKQLPKPIGIMACYDFRGQELLEACREAHIRVPDEVGVIGQHNDETVCEFCDPPLSSVIPNPRLAGYLAASLLHKMLQGEVVAAGVYKIPPIGVAARRSTDVVAVPDEDVAAAVRFIRDHAVEGIDVRDVLAAVPVSRSVLERKFQKFLGFTPHELIVRTKVRHAQELLVQSDLSIERIAALCGFSSGEYMCTVFRRELGVSPREARRNARPGHY